jgi:hypothetical protein
MYRLLTAALVSAAAFAQPVAPDLRGETLDGSKIALYPGKATILVLGFSRKAGDLSAAWRDHIASDFGADFGADAHAAWFVVAFLESAPSLVRGMIKSAMRSGTPVPARSHTIVAVSGEAVWKKFAGVKDDKLPCLLLMDGAGRIAWSACAAFEQARYSALKDAAAALLKQRQPKQ